MMRFCFPVSHTHIRTFYSTMYTAWFLCCCCTNFLSIFVNEQSWYNIDTSTDMSINFSTPTCTMHWCCKPLPCVLSSLIGIMECKCSQSFSQGHVPRERKRAHIVGWSVGVLCKRFWHLQLCGRANYFCYYYSLDKQGYRLLCNKLI